MSYEERRRQQLTAEYLWRIAEGERQVLFGFPLARLANSVDSLAFVEVMEKYSKDEQIERMRALDRWGMSSAFAVLGETLSRSEDRLARDTRAQVNSISKSNRLYLQEQIVRDNQLLKRGSMATKVVTALKSTLGKNVKKAGGDSRFFTTPIVEWYIDTGIFFGPRIPYRINIEQTIKRWPDEVIPSGDNLLILDMYITEWEISREDEITKIAEAINGVLQYTMEAIPKITAQISDYTPHPIGFNDHIRASLATYNDLTK
ncbi:hypothetical protein CCAX7_13750 [Capsulimonas corticalis]|uniref:Uncharacterized protein n=1 Tax=Capsulimonas corticalis TaxID=2219043 RepID=A0A402D6Q4_9BACT|nr:hypothetical protein [Capsulimonas corticalis]BDI29324.1 hypothetical protein CCAX7_13750 [Capsulimonas corticalis]